MTTATAKLTGRITIDPPLNQDELDLLPAASCVRVAIATEIHDDLVCEYLGEAIVPSSAAPLSTATIAYDVRTLIALFPGHRFEGSLVREAAERFGGAKSRIEVLDDGKTVRY